MHTTKSRRSKTFGWDGSWNDISLTQAHGTRGHGHLHEVLLTLLIGGGRNEERYCALVVNRRVELDR